MKKFLFFAMCMFFSLMCVPAFAQFGGQDSGFNWGFESFAALVAVIPVVTEFLKRFIKPPSGLFTQVLSWGIGLVLTFIFWLIGLGFLAGISWWMMLIYGLGASLVANGIFDIGFITSIFDWFFKKNE